MYQYILIIYSIYFYTIISYHKYINEFNITHVDFDDCMFLD